MSAAGDASGSPAVARTVNPVARVLLVTLGLTFVAIGFVGMAVPGLPTTSFMILALWCFARSSERFEQWLLNMRVIGPMLQDYRAGLGMPRRAKVIAIAMMVLFAGCSCLLLRERWWAVALIVALVLIGTAYITMRVPTREQVLRQREVRQGR